MDVPAGPMQQFSFPAWWEHCGHVEVEQVAGHCRWHENTECATEAKGVVQGQFTQLLEGQKRSHCPGWWW